MGTWSNGITEPVTASLSGYRGTVQSTRTLSDQTMDEDEKAIFASKLTLTIEQDANVDIEVLNEPLLIWLLRQQLNVCHLNGLHANAN